VARAISSSIFLRASRHPVGLHVILSFSLDILRGGRANDADALGFGFIDQRSQILGIAGSDNNSVNPAAHEFLKTLASPLPRFWIGRFMNSTPNCETRSASSSTPELTPMRNQTETAGGPVYCGDSCSNSGEGTVPDSVFSPTVFSIRLTSAHSLFDSSLWPIAADVRPRK